MSAVLGILVFRSHLIFDL